MPVSVARLRRWFAAGVLFVCIAVLGAYFYARHRVQNALKQVPSKIGIEIQQSAQGFTISKSEQGRTLFRLQAGKAIQFKQGGRAELHDVTITLYGRDSSRFDQVYGADFEYDQQSGTVTSPGEVSIDLQANPQGLLNPDQAPPKELKNSIHLRTSGLVFNKNSGDAWTPAEINFRVPQATGSAVGAKYVAKGGVLTLDSQVKIVVNGAKPATILAQQAVLQKAPRQIVLRYPHAESPEQEAQADELTLFLRDDNTLDHALAAGNVHLESTSRVAPDAPVRGRHAKPLAPTWSHVAARNLELRMKPGNRIENVTLAGGVRFLNEGPQRAEASAGRAVLNFAGRNVITTVHAGEQVKLWRHSDTNSAQDMEMTAPSMDFFVAGGNRLTQAETIGPPQILLTQAGDKGQLTRVSADKFTAKFDSQGQISHIHGEAKARVVTTTPPQVDRVSTSDSIDAYFRPGTGIESLLQQGHFTYSTGTRQAFAEFARYTPADQTLALGGSPRIVDAGMATTARAMQLNRATGEAFALGDVKTTYSELKPQAGGALLASSDPIHVTAEKMTARNNPTAATYTGSARLWQDANVVEAPWIEFQKEQRTLVADAKPGQPVSMVLAGTDKNGKATPVKVTASRMIYRDSERKAHLEGGVAVRGSELTITSAQMDVSLKTSLSPTGETPVAPQSLGTGVAKLEKIVASGSVLITVPNRRATGDQLTYTAADDKFVLTGGPPSIFDAEHGKITGVSLTLFRHDDRVVVEGDASSPSVTQTRVVR